MSATSNGILPVARIRFVVTFIICSKLLLSPLGRYRCSVLRSLPLLSSFTARRIVDSVLGAFHSKLCLLKQFRDLLRHPRLRSDSACAPQTTLCLSRRGGRQRTVLPLFPPVHYFALDAKLANCKFALPISPPKYAKKAPF